MAHDGMVLARQSPPPGGVGSAGDLTQLAVRRLVIASAVAVAVGMLALPLTLLRQPNVGVRADTARPLWVLLVGIALSVGLFLVVRAKRLDASLKIDAALAYLVLISLLAGLFRHWLPYVDSDVVRGVSPVALTVLFVAVVVPVPPAKMAIAAVGAAVADAMALGLTLVLTDNPVPPWNLWLWLLLPDVVVVPIAVLTARTLFQLGESVRRAREMGAYRLVEKLGSGGMGEVWRADHRTLARPAAIKLVRPELLGARESQEAANMLNRFEREARTTARLTSPHTIAVYDFGRAEDGAFYYVMELLEGMDLERLSQRFGAIPQARVVHLLLQACHSLRDAHDSGLIHRDIKPANLFVCQRGGDRDFVKVLDFGLVKIEDAEPDAKLTDVGALPGTPAFMAPELSHGHDATTASDIYALGCVAYQLLSGHLVFEDRSHPMQQILAHLELAPPRLDPELGVDPSLERLVMRCLEKDPADRPASVADIEETLRATGLATGWTASDAERWWRDVETSEATAAQDLALSPTVPATR